MRKPKAKVEPMTVKGLINALYKMEPDLTVYACIQGVPYVPVVEAKVDRDSDGGVVLLMTPADHEANQLASEHISNDELERLAAQDDQLALVTKLASNLLNTRLRLKAQPKARRSQ